MSYHPTPEAVKVRAKAIVGQLYDLNQEMGMLEPVTGRPLIGLHVDGAKEGDYCAIAEQEPVQGKPYYTVTVMLNGHYLMTPLSASPTLRLKLESELARLMGEAMQR